MVILHRRARQPRSRSPPAAPASWAVAGSALPRRRRFVKSCSRLRNLGGWSSGQSSANFRFVPAGPDRVPALRHPLRQGLLLWRASTAHVPSRTRTRSGADVHRLHQKGTRSRSTSRSCPRPRQPRSSVRRERPADGPADAPSTAEERFAATRTGRESSAASTRSSTSSHATRRPSGSSRRVARRGIRAARPARVRAPCSSGHPAARSGGTSIGTSRVPTPGRSFDTLSPSTSHRPSTSRAFLTATLESGWRCGGGPRAAARR